MDFTVREWVKGISWYVGLTFATGCCIFGAIVGITEMVKFGELS